MTDIEKRTAEALREFQREVEAEQSVEAKAKADTGYTPPEWMAALAGK